MGQLLEATAAVFAESGYEGATMTEIAQRAGASIGAVYQYFPNKEALVRALRTRYGQEMEERWTDLEEATTGMPVKELAQQLIDVMVGFLRERPAYFAILDAPVRYRRDQEARTRLRRRIADMFRSRKPALTSERAYRMAHVALQIIKSMNRLYAEADAKEGEEIIKEYKVALAAYLEARLNM